MPKSIQNNANETIVEAHFNRYQFTLTIHRESILCIVFDIYLCIQCAYKVKELMELKRMKEELEAEIAAAEDEIKAVMGSEETLLAGAFKVSWKTFTSSRLDSTALKKALPEIAAKFTKTTTARRFSIN